MTESVVELIVSSFQNTSINHEKINVVLIMEDYSERQQIYQSTNAVSWKVSILDSVWFNVADNNKFREF